MVILFVFFKSRSVRRCIQCFRKGSLHFFLRRQNKKLALFARNNQAKFQMGSPMFFGIVKIRNSHYSLVIIKPSSKGIPPMFFGVVKIRNSHKSLVIIKSISKEVPLCFLASSKLETRIIRS